MNVMIAFWSRRGSTERVGLAAALGAIQGRGSIRIRWVKEEQCDASDSAWLAERTRMEAEYIQPRQIDVEWAHGIVLASPEHVGPETAEWQRFFALPGLTGKKVLLVGNPALGPVLQACQVTVAEAAEATAAARKLAEGAA